ncbi:MAG: hypothetical protein R6W96_01345 [Clostridia bacterium]
MNDGKVPFVAKLSLVLGILTLLGIGGSVALGLLFPGLGMINLIRNLAFPLALGALVCGILARQRIIRDGLPGRNIALAGLVMGAASIAMIVLLTVGVALFFLIFLPMH